MKTSNKARLRHALATTLAMGASLHGAPVWADGTPATTTITNNATATFTDGTTTYDSTSNVVDIQVAEIAGIGVIAETPVKTSSADTVPITNSDLLYVDFVIRNIGNDPTQFFVPGQATLSDSVNFSQNGLIQIVAVNGATITPVNVPDGSGGTANGNTTGVLLATNATQGSIRAADPTQAVPIVAGTITIRVPIKVSPTASSNATTTVTIGKTNGNGSTATDTQNLPRINDNLDLYTFDNPSTSTAPGEAATTTPTNGTREAMATSAEIKIGSRLQAFATILKTASYVPGLPNTLTDDVLTYSLALKVDPPTSLPAGLAASDLHGTKLDVTGSGTNDRFVLVSDAIPTGLQLAATTPLATTEANWSPVYSTTPIAANSTALTATWTIGQPPTGTAVTRVGFIYNTDTKGALPQGATVYRFTIATTPTPTFTGGTIANIAQAFGQSSPGNPSPGTQTQIVYDESGDPDSNNGLKGSNPDALVPGGITNGVADPDKDGTDPTNNNTGADGGTASGANGTNTKGGEDTIVTISVAPFNGPFGQPGASGPTDKNDDFTKAPSITPVPPGQQTIPTMTSPISQSSCPLASTRSRP
jgi:hypothetical protein